MKTKALANAIKHSKNNLSKAAESLLSKGEYLNYDIDSIYALVQHTADNYQPTMQKVAKVEKIKVKVLKVRETFTETFKVYNDKATRKEVKNICRGLEAIHNHCQSVLDMIGSGNLDKSELQVFVTKQENRCKKLKHLISSLTTEKVEIMAPPASENSDSEQVGIIEVSDDMKIIATKDFDNDEVKDDLSPDEEGNPRSRTMDEILRKSEHMLRHYDSFKGKLPDSKTDKRAFVIYRMPVIPVMASDVDWKDFEAIGMVVDKIGRYVVIKNQLVVGFNGSVKKDFGESELKDLTEAIRQQHGVSYQIVGKGHPKKGFMWFWLFPEKQLSALTKLNKHLALRNWGLAFSG